MKVIQYVDPTGHTLVSRYPRQGTEAIELGSQLIVEESQEAVFLRDGKALDTFGPGRHTLATMNLPLLGKILGAPFEGKSPFQAAVFFVATKTFLDLKWGTKEPVVYRDAELSMIRLRAFGKFAIRIADAQQFVNEIVGTMGVYTTDGVEAYFKDVIVARLTDLLGENLQSIFDLPKVYDELGIGLKARVDADFRKFGVELVDLYMGAITPPDEVQKQIDERSGMEAVGDMNDYLKFKAAKAMGDAAQASGGGEGGGEVSSGMGLGMGAGMGMMLPQMMKEAMSSTPSAPSGGQPPAGTPAPTNPPAAPAGAAAAAAGAAAGADPSAADESAASPIPAGAAFCHQCGAKLPSDAKFCPACGTKVATA